MTRINVFCKDDRFVRIICEGHTGYGVEGEDIVCAALSSIVQTGALGMLSVAGASVDIIRDDRRGYFELVIPKDMSKQMAHDVQVIFATMMCGVRDLYEEYSDFIDLEVRNVL